MSIPPTQLRFYLLESTIENLCLPLLGFSSMPTEIHTVTLPLKVLKLFEDITMTSFSMYIRQL